MLILNDKCTADLTDSCTQCNFEEPLSDTELDDILDESLLEFLRSQEQIEYTSHLLV